MIKKYLYAFLLSMVPIIEMKGAIPLAAAMGIPIQSALIVCMLGNMFPVPFIILLYGKILKWLGKVKYIGDALNYFMDKAKAKAEKIGNYELFGVFLFVAIPLPGTGAWMGSLVSTVLGLPLKKAFPVIIAGLAVNALIMAFISYGLGSAVIGLFS